MLLKICLQGKIRIFFFCLSNAVFCLMTWQIGYVPGEIVRCAPAAYDGGRTTAFRGSPPVCASVAWSAAAPPPHAGAASTTAAAVDPLYCN